VGKQYSYGKGIAEGLSEIEQLKLKNKLLSVELEVLKKYKEGKRAPKLQRLPPFTLLLLFY
jgi:hypothetical protein